GQTASALRTMLSRLNGWPIRSHADASPPASRHQRARLRADVVRYSFIVVDLHHLFLAGLPAHLTPRPFADPTSCCCSILILGQLTKWPPAEAASNDHVSGTHTTEMFRPALPRLFPKELGSESTCSTKLREHLGAVVTMMQLSSDWHDFM